MTLPDKPFGDFDSPGWFSEETITRYYQCPRCGIEWQLLRLYRNDLPSGASEGYYLSLQGEDTMTWLGNPKAKTDEIQAKARRMMLSHSCLRTRASSNEGCGGCGNFLLILGIIWLVATIGGSGILAIIGTVGSIVQIVWVGFLIAVFLAIAALIAMGILKLVNFFRSKGSQ